MLAYVQMIATTVRPHRRQCAAAHCVAWAGVVASTRSPTRNGISHLTVHTVHTGLGLVQAVLLTKRLVSGHIPTTYCGNKLCPCDDLIALGLP